jgi:hypothetical protein
MKTKRIKFQVPIHDVSVVVVITDDIPAAYKREFGIEIGNAQMACLGYNKRKFGLFFEPKARLRQEIVVHELFHLTHRILEKNCMNFDGEHHEQGAYLCEYLTKIVFGILRKI